MLKSLWETKVTIQVRQLSFWSAVKLVGDSIVDFDIRRLQSQGTKAMFYVVHLKILNEWRQRDMLPNYSLTNLSSSLTKCQFQTYLHASNAMSWYIEATWV